MSPGRQSPPPPLAANDFVLLYRSFDSIIQIPALTPGGITNCRHGAFHHDDIIGKLTWGETIEPRTSQEKFKRGMVLVRPTPALITDTVRHRTQIIYHGDISMILTGLDVRPGKKVVEAGTGSGSLSTSLIQALRHHGSDRSLDGHLYTFEYHEPRFIEAKSDFERYGFSDIVTIQHRDVIHDGLPDELVDMDAVFWDLPAAWKCITTAKKHLREGGLLCTFSPCIEQVMKNCAAMEADGFTGIHTYECMLKEWGVMSTTKLNRTRKRGRDDRAKPNAVSGNVDEQLSYQLPMRGHTSYLTFATKCLDDEKDQPNFSVSVEQILSAKAQTDPSPSD
ncbi:tRNA (adenine(58)-N(1))-methyltransferase catalytic subunit trmt61a [Perkinsus olseni]|uniref:tRNA (adenine(58)-N(1))-methyltransferase n=1 Tax=Perkinsus olseni TaxID=32597 RepID=A0A7J6L904_PEROL|nr:tRNA (adenine(58)-N(1))-methyltransferase catalytic subunit trmt61a [Perkinsus olseni]